MSHKLTLPRRPRRLRHSSSRREMIAETYLQKSQLVEPLFFGSSSSTALKSLPGISRHSADDLIQYVEQGLKMGLKNYALFPSIPETQKNSAASEALNPRGFNPEMIRRLKKEFPEILIFADVALDPYSSDGHDGLVKDGQILNDESVQTLAKMACVLAEAGADFVSPSDMMDGRIGAIRKALDEANCENTGILSYCAKYASCFYGPFREALDSAPKFGDKKTYQMDPRNSREALIELELDLQEGADIVMVKPALSYLDVIAKIRAASDVPLAAYNVSGEYAMLHFAAQNGALDLDRAVHEVLTSIRRAGADLIFTYHARHAALKLL